MSQQINLFNPIFLKQKKYFSAVAIGQALALILIGALSISVFLGYQYSSVQQEETSTFAQLTKVQAQLNKINAEFAPHPKNQTLEDSVAKTDQEVKSLQQVFDTLQKGEFGNTDGYSAYLLAFSRQIVDGLWITGFSISGAGNEMALRGRSLRPELVPLYITRLKNEKVMQGKTFSTLEIHLPQPGSANNEHPAAAAGAPPYLEFDLRSSGIKKEQITSSGETYTQPYSSLPITSSVRPGSTSTPDTTTTKVTAQPSQSAGEKEQ